MKDPQKSRLSPRLFVLGLTASGALSVLQAQAPVEVNIDFNSDPIAGGVFSFVSTEPTPWRAEGGVNNSGYLAITDARGSQSSHIAFKDYTPGLVVKAFTFECDLRIGGGTVAPADGFSLNFVSAEDPIVSDIESGTNPSGSRYSGTDDEASLPEEGSRTGLGMGFDLWQSSTINGVQDVIGISIRVNGELKFQLPVPLGPGNLYPGGNYDPTPYRNLPPTDPNYAKSLTTGALTDEDLNYDGVVDDNDWNTAQPDYFPGDTEWPKWIKNLVWEHFKAEVTETGHVKIWWKDVELTPEGGIETGFAPIPGRIVFAGRTGGSWAAIHVDNIHMSLIPADALLIGNVTGTPIGFSVNIVDSGPSVLDPNSIQIELDGNPVTPTSVTKDAGITKFTFQDPANPMAAGSTHTVAITVKDTRGIEVSDTREFTVPDYVTLPPEFKVAGASNPGFDLDLYYLDHNVGNSIARAERQLHGDLGENFAYDDINFVRIDSTVVDTVINFSQDNGDFITPEQNGVFTDANGKPDARIPGLNWVELQENDAWRDNLAIRIKTVLHFPKQGIYTLIFTSDDGFRTIAHKNYREQLNSLILSQFDGGRGASDSAVTLYIAEPGYYPVSTVWFEGGGGANLEWSAITMDSNGQRYLINDTEPGALKAYRTISDPKIPSAVSFVDPVRDSGNPYSPMTPIRADILNGTSPVNVGTIKLLVNDVQVAATVSGTSTGATISYTPAEPYPSGSTVKVTVQFQEQDGTAYEGSYTFDVRSYQNLPTTLRSPLGSENTDEPGFLVKTVQLQAVNNGMPNNLQWAEAVLTGAPRYDGYNTGNLATLNRADLTGFGPDGYYVETETINYSHTEGDTNGNFTPDRQHPGIPGLDGSTENYVSEFKTYVVFPTAGLYTLGVNSDDGFRVTLAEAPTRQYFEIVSPASIAGPVAAVPASRGVSGAAFGGPIPTTPIEGDIVYVGGEGCDPIDMDLTGKIALIDRGTCAFVQKALNAQNAGAIAAIIAMNDGTPDDMPFVMGGDSTSITIPVMMISYNDGVRLKNNLDGLRATIGDDGSLILGEFNNGRGASDTTFDIYVTEPGVYPLRCLYEQGGGGGNVEWFSVLADGTKVLLNDTSNPNALRCYRSRTWTPPVQPVVTIGMEGGQVRIEFSAGRLQSADAVTGPWSDVAGATSPYLVDPTDAHKFYRAVNP